MIKIEAPPADLPFLCSLCKCTTRFTGVAAIVEFALSDIGMKFDKTPRQFLTINMIQTEFLHAGRVDNVAVPVEVVESCVGSGVATGVERDGDSGSGAFRSRDESVDDGRFAHTRLTYQNAEVALQVGH